MFITGKKQKNNKKKRKKKKKDFPHGVIHVPFDYILLFSISNSLREWNVLINELIATLNKYVIVYALAMFVDSFK